MRFFKRVPPGLRLGDDACIFQRCVPDSPTIKGFNSGRSEERGKKKQRKKKQVHTTVKVVGGEVTGDYAYVGSIILNII